MFVKDTFVERKKLRYFSRSLQKVFANLLFSRVDTGVDPRFNEGSNMKIRIPLKNILTNIKIYTMYS